MMNISVCVRIEMSRFRVAGRDPNDPDADENIIDVNAEWVNGIGRIPQPILRKYILYARYKIDHH